MTSIKTPRLRKVSGRKLNYDQLSLLKSAINVIYFSGKRDQIYDLAMECIGYVVEDQLLNDKYDKIQEKSQKVLIEKNEKSISKS